ncbi:MAG TPA: helix-turn-helix domain-containing protein [Dehalococcoidia bacterium]|nr:helix-turn-helix domain-containing protein [Dehalococcoidia bacterium]
MLDLSKLRDRRTTLGLSQIQLSYLARVPSIVISECERGLRVPWPAARKALAEALQMPEAELFPDGDRPKKEEE